MREDKPKRQRKIRDLVERRGLGSQDELRRALAEAGFPVAQSTLSRDLHELGMVRMRTADGFRYLPAREVESSGPEAHHARDGGAEVRYIVANESAVIIRTRQGHAKAVAVELDRMQVKRVLGTVAGDDTILVIPASVRSTKALVKELEKLYGID